MNKNIIRVLLTTVYCSFTFLWNFFCISNENSGENKFDNQPKTAQKQQFKEYISDMSNYSAETIETGKTTQLEEQKETSELDLS